MSKSSKAYTYSKNPQSQKSRRCVGLCIAFRFRFDIRRMDIMSMRMQPAFLPLDQCQVKRKNMVVPTGVGGRGEN